MVEQQLGQVSQRLWTIEYGQRVNWRTIEVLSRFELWRIFRRESPRLVNLYLHQVLKQWIKRQNQNSETFLTQLKRLIRKLGLSLNELEQHNLNLIEERVFSTFRHIKVLDVNFPFYKKEFAAARFLSGELYQVKKAGRLVILLKGELLITSRRFIIASAQTHLSFSYRQLTRLSFETYGLQFGLAGHSTTYVIRIHDQITLINTFINVVQKRVRWMAARLPSWEAAHHPSD
ncbi:hypothetical protein [Mycoplasma sp. ATU-Cv-703]|uniref:hypothetical protein n=1 Tax=Mycoplasma sp. ATU-Cv-703 TaxID=2498595 RepID=UPI000FDE2A35